MSAPPELTLSLQEKEIHKDFVKEMQHARNEGGVDTKVLAKLENYAIKHNAILQAHKQDKPLCSC